MKFLVFVFGLILAQSSLVSQDTFSIVCADSTTRQVGSAGASCVDLIAFGINNPSFLGELFPNTGAINSQASYLPSNQEQAAIRMRAGDTPEQIANWLYEHDTEDNPDIRQYGIVRFVGKSAVSQGFTGQSCMDFKNHITGSIDGIAYSIQGNILSGQHILDSMEARFRRESGSIACKLMAALQGANSIGADIRCAPNNTSSLFSFLKVAKPSDDSKNPSVNISFVSSNGEQIEPITELQRIFDDKVGCQTVGIIENGTSENVYFPNPADNIITFTSPQKNIEIISILGKLVFHCENETQSINIAHIPEGIYSIRTTSLLGKLFISH